MKKIKVDGDCSLTCTISSPILNPGTEDAKRMSDNLALVVKDHSGKKVKDYTVLLTKENAVDLAITVLKYAQKMNVVLSDVECVTDGVRGSENYIKNNTSIGDVFKLYQI